MEDRTKIGQTVKNNVRPGDWLMFPNCPERYLVTKVTHTYVWLALSGADPQFYIRSCADLRENGAFFADPPLTRPPSSALEVLQRIDAFWQEGAAAGKPVPLAPGALLGDDEIPIADEVRRVIAAAERST